jgi:hypothetical protein
MPKPGLRLPRSAPPFLELSSSGRVIPQETPRFTAAQLQDIRLTVRRVPEVMVKITGGGRSVGAVRAHLGYISQGGKLELETDDVKRHGREEQEELLHSWHLDLSAGQQRHTDVKLVHNITLSMPSPTPPEAVLAAAKAFAREKFAAGHSYAMALHTHQKHPHVHLVVKAEGLDGRRLHVDKALLRGWRQDFARLLREQDIAADATPRSVRGQTKRSTRDASYRAKNRRGSEVLRRE